MTSSSSASPSWENRFFWGLLAAALVALTLRLGFWQLSRAEQKIQWQQSIEAQAALPALTLYELHSEPQAWSQTHRRVMLQGEWLNDRTVFLDNRAHLGRVGFWVMTPLRVQAGGVVWVQRGWIERDALDPLKMPSLPLATNGLTFEGRIAPALSQIFELGQTPALSAQNLPHIRANLDLAQMQSLVQDNVLAVVIQTGPQGDGLRRDWPPMAASAGKNQAYALQWFAFSALLAFLYLWFQWIKAYRHGRQTP